MQKKKLTVTVVIPAFNEEKNLPRCLSSLKKQSYPPDEIIVVDNNSTDKTSLVAKKFGAKVLKEKNQGIAYARDCGFRKAKGEIIARTDADAILPRDWLFKIVENFKKYPEIAAITGTSAFHDSSSYFNPLSESWVTFWLYSFRLFAGHHQLAGSNFAIKREVFKKIAPCSENPYFLEDVDLSFHAAEHGEIIFDQSLLVYASSRRLKESPLSAFAEYPLRGAYTFLLHKFPSLNNHRKSSIRAKRR